MAIELRKQPRQPRNVVLRKFADDLLNSVQEGFVTQQIFPTEVYPGYKEVNAERKRRGQWYSTGEGAKSFTTTVKSQEGFEQISLTFNEYLRFADMGVGQGTRFEEVKANRKARHNKRYIATWDRWDGKSHRPAIMFEMRHLQSRMLNFLQDFYGQECNVMLYKSFEYIPLKEITI